ncbi:DgyrCDS14479 [Dimorphilus gyrociliatus]|uniref:phosphoethanolamine N-methyltransferase n=1 Tax=Dimorphilus gyrociliatus TaxID=2664684 RepID=A0A7I8WDQ0_9ANNE|nr:DgyrCDS14479 [Dimorphilus gyrociliatus]
MENTCKAMKDYFYSLYTGPTIDDMLFHCNAEEFHHFERDETLGMIGDVSGLGAGIGRLTGHLAKTAKQVVAVDFVKEYCDKNRELHQSLQNVQVKHCDVVFLKEKNHSFDLVTTNWLFICFHSTGNKVRVDNPTLYRTPREYIHILNDVLKEYNGTIYGFNVDFIKSSKFVIFELKKNNQFCCMSAKVAKDCRENIDTERDLLNDVILYEKVFGEDFLSNGASAVTFNFIEKLNIQKEEFVLDIGCKIGGSSIHMAKKYGCIVYGYDLSPHKIALAFQRAHKQKLFNVVFEQNDFTSMIFPESFFSVIYCGDSIGKVKDKLAILKTFYHLEQELSTMKEIEQDCKDISKKCLCNIVNNWQENIDKCMDDELVFCGFLAFKDENC